MPHPMKPPALVAADADNILERKEKRLPVPLTPEELEDRAAKLGTVTCEIADAKDRKKLLTAQVNETIKEAQAEANRLAPIVRDRAEPRLVPTTTWADWDHGVARVVREDTGEVVEERAITQAERQKRLPGVSP